MREASASSPVPNRGQARRAAAGQRCGLQAHLDKPKHRTARSPDEPGTDTMTDQLTVRVEHTCRQLLAGGGDVTFARVADRVGVGRATLYRRPSSAPSSKNTGSVARTH